MVFAVHPMEEISSLLQLLIFVALVQLLEFQDLDHGVGPVLVHMEEAPQVVRPIKPSRAPVVHPMEGTSILLQLLVFVALVQLLEFQDLDHGVGLVLVQL